MVSTSKQSSSKRKSSPRKQYCAEELEKAVEEARKTGKIRRAAKKYQVPFSTVQRYLRTPPKSKRPGPGTVLTAEEESRIKTWILYMSRAGFPLSDSDVFNSVVDYVDKIRKKRDIPTTFPSRNWTKRFLERHPELKKKRITKLSKAAAVVTEQQIRNWFLEVEETLQEDGINISIFSEPERIYNMDESGFRLVPQDFTAICGPNVENTYFVHNNSDKDSYTALFGCNAQGEITPPMILYPGKRVSRDMADNTPDGWSVGVSDEGWQTSKTFYEYITNDFYNWLLKNSIKFPVILFVDGHKSHISIELAEFCANHEIVLVALYPNSTRILQPLDRQFFGPLKQIWSKVLRKHVLSGKDAKVTKLNFGSLLKTAVDNFTHSKECVKKAFKLCGLSPWDVNEIDFSRLPTSAKKVTESVEPKETAEENDEPEDGQDAFKVQLHYAEKGLTEDQLTRFTSNWKSDYWYGPLDELALFNYWKSLKDKSEGLMFTEPLEQFQSVTLELTFEEDGTCASLAQHEDSNDQLKDQPPVEDGDGVQMPDQGADEDSARNDQNDPFDSTFIWPKVNEKSGSKKQRRKEHVPSVATSNRWRLWYDKKDQERKQEEDAKTARAEERKLARMKKEEEQAIRKKKKDEKKLRKEASEQEKENNPSSKRKKRTLKSKSKILKSSAADNLSL